MKIRPYQPDDLETVLTTWENASEIGHPFLSADFIRAEKERIPSVYLPKGDAWVATIEGHVVGFTVLHGNEVGALFVNPDYHKQGVGSALLDKALKIHRQLTLEVFKKNRLAQNFYLQYGFTLVDQYLHEDSGMVMLRMEYKC